MWLILCWIILGIFVFRDTYDESGRNIAGFLVFVYPVSCCVLAGLMFLEFAALAMLSEKPTSQTTAIAYGLALDIRDLFPGGIAVVVGETLHLGYIVVSAAEGHWWWLMSGGLLVVWILLGSLQFLVRVSVDDALKVGRIQLGEIDERHG